MAEEEINNLEYILRDYPVSTVGKKWKMNRASENYVDILNMYKDVICIAKIVCRKGHKQRHIGGKLFKNN